MLSIKGLPILSAMLLWQGWHMVTGSFLRISTVKLGLFCPPHWFGFVHSSYETITALFFIFYRQCLKYLGVWSWGKGKGCYILWCHLSALILAAGWLLPCHSMEECYTSIQFRSYCCLCDPEGLFSCRGLQGARLHSPFLLPPCLKYFVAHLE